VKAIASFLKQNKTLTKLVLSGMEGRGGRGEGRGVEGEGREQEKEKFLVTSIRH
jgi:hypothetical protein